MRSRLTHSQITQQHRFDPDQALVRNCLSAKHGAWLSDQQYAMSAFCQSHEDQLCMVPG